MKILGKIGNIKNYAEMFYFILTKFAAKLTVLYTSSSELSKNSVSETNTLFSVSLNLTKVWPYMQLKIQQPHLVSLWTTFYDQNIAVSQQLDKQNFLK